MLLFFPLRLMNITINCPLHRFLANILRKFYTSFNFYITITRNLLQYLQHGLFLCVLLVCYCALQASSYYISPIITNMRVGRFSAPLRTLRTRLAPLPSSLSLSARRGLHTTSQQVVRNKVGVSFAGVSFVGLVR